MIFFFNFWTTYRLMNIAGSRFDEEKHIDGIHCEDIASRDLVFVVSEEAALGTRGSLKGRCDPMSLQDIAHGSGTQPMTKVEQFPLDSVIPPASILFGKAYN
jgi:hypothetical protein